MNEESNKVSIRHILVGFGVIEVEGKASGSINVQTSEDLAFIQRLHIPEGVGRDFLITAVQIREPKNDTLDLVNLTGAVPCSVFDNCEFRWKIKKGEFFSLHFTNTNPMSRTFMGAAIGFVEL